MAWARLRFAFWPPHVSSKWDVTIGVPLPDSCGACSSGRWSDIGGHETA
jgi:hypothetical protein